MPKPIRRSAARCGATCNRSSSPRCLTSGSGISTVSLRARRSSTATSRCHGRSSGTRGCRSEGRHRLQTHGMTRYLASRFAGMVIVMLLVATLVFFITRLAPGDPAAVILGEQANAHDYPKDRAPYRLLQAPAPAIGRFHGEAVHCLL